MDLFSQSHSELRSRFQTRISKYCHNWWPRETYKTACKLWFAPYQSTNTMDYDIVKCTKMRVFIMQFSFIGKLSWFIDINSEERDQNKLFISRFLNIHQNVYQLTSFGIFLTKLEHQILNITVYGLSLYQWNVVNIVFLL